MLDFDLGLGQEAQKLVYVQEEPAVEIALPQVFSQPLLTNLQRGRLANVEGFAAHIARHHQNDPEAALGPDYQELVLEFQPLFAWAMACWDYLLSTEGCRFVPRGTNNRAGIRGDYRVITDKDYSRMVHAIFRRCVLEFSQEPTIPTLSQWMRQRFWPLVSESYRQLENPPDPRQRILTPYSYLRCIPYQFLNDVHQELVYRITKRLPQREYQAVEAYFFHFYTEAAAAESIHATAENLRALLRQGLTKLLINQRLVYCLLRQIERY